MFWIITSLLLGVSLAMDAFAVSITNGLAEPQMPKKKLFFIAGMFGLFQGVMPLIGYLLADVLFNTFLSDWVNNVVPILGFAILAYLGTKMIIEACKKKEEDEIKKVTIKDIFFQAIATSIDALTVGIAFVGKGNVEVYTTFIMIAVITFMLCVLAVIVGKKFGDKFTNKAEIAGGIILILIGCKFLIEWLITLF